MRRPLQVFYDVPMNARWQRDDDLVATLSSNTETEHRMFTIDGRTGGKAGEYEPSQRDPLEPLEKYKTADLEELGGDTAQAQVVAGQDEAQPQIVTRGFGAGTGRGGGGAVAFSRREALWYGGQAYLSRLLQPADPAFDDLTAFVPALASDDADAWRDAFAPAGAQPAPHAVDAAARAQLERARAALAPGVYRWDDRDVAVDAAHRFGWRQSSPFGLAETASYDGSHLVRRYAELGLDVTRTADRDDPALQLAYLPLWIAPVDHYARWFDVVARGPHEVELRHARAVGAPLVLVLTFDERDRLIAIRDGAGAHLVDVTWGATGPSAAHVRGEPIDVGFTGDPVADAPAWAHGGSTAGVEVELPAHLVAYEQRELAKAIVGSPQWRQIQRQLLVSEAATGDRVGSWTTLSQLQGAGGLELGDVVLASGGLATAGDRERTAALAAIATTPIGRYLAAAQVYASGAAHVAPVTRDGLIGALWSLREVTAMLQRGRAGDVSSDIAAISERAPEARYIAASAASQWGALEPDQLAAVWDAAAIGPFRNQARAQAALVLASRGNYDAAADRIVALVSSLDLRAIPPQLVNAQSTFASSRRGTAGWDLAWAQLRERVLAGDSFAHVMALVPIAAQRSTDLPAVLARGAALAGDDADEVIELARAAAAYGQVAWAARAIDPLVKRAPSRELYQLAAGLA
ncbi:MAG TPA: hypothetical protein VLX92_10300, partial [Kofleriaceae bacterium]|nr:hypothetical protein [Kofleriaceae bacterium]